MFLVGTFVRKDNTKKNIYKKKDLNAMQIFFLYRFFRASLAQEELSKNFLNVLLFFALFSLSGYKRDAFVAG
ncbi:MAG: hypothetical protein D3915_06305 [Candidatus Electrothrix sp. AU1_5]|nr:hypothetical protein [Candidatus Electrothrix gigas]